MTVINRAALRYPALKNFIQTGPNRFTDPGEAARRGLRPYVTAATAAARGVLPAPKRLAVPTVLRSTPSAPPASSVPARSQPHDIPAAMASGLSNQAINELIAKGALHRPKSSADAELWPVAAWRAAEERGLVW